MCTKIIYLKFQASLLCFRPTTKHLKYTKEILKIQIRIFQSLALKIIYLEFQASPLCFRTTTEHLKYTKEILKNTKEKSGIRIFQLLALNTILWDTYCGWLHSWGPNASFDTHIEIYKGNSEEYKGKIRNQDISFFGHTNNFLWYLRWLAAFLRS